MFGGRFHLRFLIYSLGCLHSIIRQTRETCHQRSDLSTVRFCRELLKVLPRKGIACHLLIFYCSHYQEDIMDRQHLTIGLVGQPIDSAFYQLRVNYEYFKHLAIGRAIYSKVFTMGGHMWRVSIYPSGQDPSDNGDYLSIWFELVSKSRNVLAINEAFLLDKDRQPCSKFAYRSNAHLFEKGTMWGWRRFVSRAELEETYLTDGYFICAITVVPDSAIPVPPSDIGAQFSNLLDSMDGVDVSFIIDGEIFYAYRAVLAARSPVFRAEFFGSVASQSSSQIQDINPRAFQIMLRFMYTDVLPRDDELGNSPFEMIPNLLAAADRYTLERLKLFCTQKLWEHVSVDNVAAILDCAEMYNCLELKSKCFDFFADEENFKRVTCS